VRTKVKEFARMAPDQNVPFKLIFLDEADALTPDAQGALRRIMEQYAGTCRFILSCNYSSKIIEPIQSRCAVFRFRPLAEDQILEMVQEVAESEELVLEDHGAAAVVHVAMGDLRRAITALQVAASLSNNITRDLVYETTATAPPEQLHAFLRSCQEDGFQPARGKMYAIIDRFGLAGTDIVNQLHRSLADVQFMTEKEKLAVTEAMAEADFRLVEGGGESLQLDALTARISTILKIG